jgi:signal transduction histidine kinase/ligand-binding sensor domain-containing protein
LGDATISALAIHPDGNVWAATFGSGVVVLTPSGQIVRSVTASSGLSDGYVTAIHIAKDGTAWMGTKRGLVRERDGQYRVWTTADGLPDDEISSLSATSTGVLSVGTKAGLRLMDGEQFTEGAVASEASVAVQFEDKFGARWLGTAEAGLIRVSWFGVDTFSKEDGLTNNNVTAIMTDREGSVWVGTNGGGVNRLRTAKFETYSVREGLGSSMAYGVWSDRDGSIWVGSENAGISIISNSGVRTITTEDGLSSNSVITIAGTPNGDVWAGTYGGGLNRIRGDEITSYSARDGLAHDVVSSIASTPDGNLWIGTDGGLSYFDGTTFTNTTEEDGLPSRLVMAVLRAADGTLWAGTYDGGIAHIDGDEIQVIDTGDGLTTNMVIALHQSSDGVIWAGTYGGGLVRISEQGIHPFTMKEGLFSDVVYGIVEDGEEQLWMTSDHGLYTVAKNDFVELISGTKERIVSTSYGREDGLRSREFNGGFQPAAWKAEDGRLIFPSIKGVAIITPGDTPTNTTIPAVHIEAVVVDGQPLSTAGDGQSTLHVSRGRVEIRFAGLSYVVPSKVRYRYRLEGYDDDWTETSDPKVVYTNLPARDFVFRVQASNNDGVWNEVGQSIAFSRPPQFWETLWFFLLVIGIIGGATATGVRLRMRSMRLRQIELERTVHSRTKDLRAEKNRVEQAMAVIEAQTVKLEELDRFKTRFFSNVSHEFRTPLTMIVGPLENALRGVYGEATDSMKRQCQIMLRNALRLLSLINQLMDLSKLEAGSMPLKAGSSDIVQFLQGIQLTVSALADKKHIKMPFTASKENIQMFFEPDKLEKVFYNLLSNALKFTPEGGEVAITVSETETEVVIEVKDNGSGIPADQLDHVFDRFHQVDGTTSADIEGTGIGLSLVKEMVMLHGGSVSVDSVFGEWTAFSVTLLKGRDHLQEDQILTDGVGDQAILSVAARLATMDLEDEEGTADEWTRVDPNAPLILVTEDNADVRGYIVGILEEHGYRTAKAVDGVDGLNKARVRRPHLILSDVMMPRMDGMEFCRQVKADDVMQHTPFILLTARATHESTIQGLDSGADDYLPKPFNVGELLARISNLLKGRQNQQVLAEQREALNRRVEEQVAIILDQRQSYEENILDERDRAVAASHLKQTILDNVSHEFRTPLTAIMGFAGILGDTVGSEDREFVDTIKENGERLLETLDGLLRLAHLKAESDLTARVRVEMGSLVGKIVDATRKEMGSPDHEITFDGGSEPALAEINRSAMESALEAVIENAVKFTPAGVIDVRVRRKEDGVAISVSDTGIGVPASRMDEVFEPFKQLSEGLTRNYGGVGIGLSVARQLIMDHGGTIEFVPPPTGVSTLVRIWIPTERARIAQTPIDRPALPPRSESVPKPDGETA